MLNPQELLLLDSIGYVAQLHFQIEGATIVSGSHGGTAAAGYVLDHPQKPRLVFFNDAGGGKNHAGTAGLAQLQAVGVAAATYSHESAQIGEAQDGLAHGIVSACNTQALAMGIAIGSSVKSHVQASSVSAPSTEPSATAAALRSFKDASYQNLANNLNELRQNIDALDEQIITLIAKRAMYVKDAARFKANHFQVSAPQRQAEVYANARAKATRHNLGFEGLEEVVEQTYRTMVAQFIMKESLYFDQLEEI